MNGRHIDDQCVHFSGVFSGRCRAGVSYADVKDQSRLSQAPRFPCQRWLDSFTSCPAAQFPAGLDRKAGRRVVRCVPSSVNKELVYKLDPPRRRRAVRVRLLAYSFDHRTLFVEVVDTGRRIAVETCFCVVAPRKRARKGGE